MITVWEGYVSPRSSRVVLVVFDGKRLGGLAVPLDDATVEFTFYRARGGRVVVHEARLGYWGVGRAYDEAFVRVYGSLDDACAHLNINKQDLNPHRRNANSRRVNAPDAPTITLEQLVRERKGLTL